MTAQLQELVSIQSAPAKITANFEEIDKALSEHLEQYNTVVTADGVKDAKATATEINKLKQTIETRRKEAVSEVSAPIRQFEEQMKALSGRCEDARQSILTQVQKFEDETRKLCCDLLYRRVRELWNEHKVGDDHCRAKVDDLIKISNVTAKGKLTSSADGAVVARVVEDRSRQNMVERRLLELENRSYKAGLSAPLTRDHIHQWIETDAETYETNLQRILDAEVQREEQAQARMRERLEREQREKDAKAQAWLERQEREAQRAEPKEETQEDTPVHTKINQSQESPKPKWAPDTVEVVLTCTFRTHVPGHITDARLDAELRKKLTAAGISSLESIQIQREGQDT